MPNVFSIKSMVYVPIPYLPTSGDLKSGDSLFCTTPPTPHPLMSLAPTPPLLHPPNQQITLAHYMASYMTYMGWKCAFIIVMTNYSLSLTKHMQKCPRNWTMNKKSSNFVKKWTKFQTKAQTCSKVHFIREIWRSNREIGRFDEKLGDSRENRESWQVCDTRTNRCTCKAIKYRQETTLMMTAVGTFALFLIIVSFPREAKWLVD